MRAKWDADRLEQLMRLRLKEHMSWEEIALFFGDVTPNSVRKVFYRKVEELTHHEEAKVEKTGPKVLLLDIETAPILAYVWGLWENNVALNQIANDWYVLSWSAKWLGSDQVMYRDQRNAKNIEDDSEILKVIWSLLDEADIVITQNGQSFDIKKLNARFIINGMKPPSSFKQFDTLVVAKKRFGFTSNKLEYMTSKLCPKSKKSDHAKFSGFELWKQCLLGNKEAWEEMEKYNKQDVLALEALYHKMQAWDNSINFSSYNDEVDERCNCGSTKFKKNGYHYTKKSKFQRYVCVDCGREYRDSSNLFSKDKKKSLKV